MKLHEWIDTKRDFTTSLNLSDELIPELDVKLALKVKFGQSTMLEIFEEMTGSEVAQYLNSVYNRKWEWLVKYISESPDIGEVNSKIINENFKNTTKGEQTGSSVNKESASNIDDFINNDMQDNQMANEAEQSGDRNREEKYKSYYTALQQLSNTDKNNIVEIILQDIKNELCLKIY